MGIELDLSKLTTPQIADAVRTKCSQYGAVKAVSVHLHPAPSGGQQPFAIVEMASAEEMSAVRRGLGDGYFAGGVTIHLAHKEA